MTRKRSSILATLVFSAVLWIVPSVGTQGMGTIGQGFVHPDSGLLGADSGTASERAAVRERLQYADSTAEAALGI